MKNLQKSTLIRFISAALFITLLVAVVFPVPGKADTARIICTTEGNTYKISFSVTVDSKRLILIGVIDDEGNGHRIYRYFLNDRHKEGELTIPRSKFGDLSRACIAVHLTSGDKRTVASDCDYF
jgi:uncharacterized membrane protein